MSTSRDAVTVSFEGEAEFTTKDGDREFLAKYEVEAQFYEDYIETHPDDPMSKKGWVLEDWEFKRFELDKVNHNPHWSWIKTLFKELTLDLDELRKVVEKQAEDEFFNGRLWSD